ncbi:MAG: MGMT family protein [Chlamydiota bacterium]
MLSTKNSGKRSEIEKYRTLGPPPVQVSFYTRSSSIFRITLAAGDRFGYRIFGDHYRREISDWIESYAQRKEGKKLPLDFAKLSPFMIRGLLAIGNIRFGHCASYGEIAALAGREKGARAIGNVCNQNPYPLVIPCHRVVRSNGSLGGFAYPIEMKRSLLAFEAYNRQRPPVSSRLIDRESHPGARFPSR